MPKCRPIFTFADAGHRDGQRGAAALLIVLGASMVFLAVAVAVASGSRQELRMSSAQAQQVALEGAITGAFNRASVMVETDAFLSDKYSDGKSLCDPQPLFPGGPYPYTCIQILSGRMVMTQPLGDLMEYPVRIVWKAAPGTDVGVSYGWVLTDPNDVNPDTGLPYIVDVKYYRNWCTPSAGNYPGPCVIGG